MSSANNYEEEFTMDNAFRSNNNNSAMKQQDDNTQSPSSNGSNDSNTSNNMVTLQLNTDTSSAERFSVWMGLTVFSMICLIALQSRRGLFDADTAGEVWVVAVFVLSFLLSLSAVVAYLLVRSIFVGHVPEIALVRVSVCVCIHAFWVFSLKVVQWKDTVSHGCFSHILLYIYIYILRCLLCILTVAGVE